MALLCRDKADTGRFRRPGRRLACPARYGPTCGRVDVMITAIAIGGPASGATTIATIGGVIGIATARSSVSASTPIRRLQLSTVRHWSFFIPTIISRTTDQRPWQYRLPPAYGPYRWVRYHNDAVLIDTYTGEVEDVIYGFFW